jgi:hypothetical protein
MLNFALPKAAVTIKATSPLIVYPSHHLKLAQAPSNGSLFGHLPQLLSVLLPPGLLVDG